jgi:hypothetical protein
MCFHFFLPYLNAVDGLITGVRLAIRRDYYSLSTTTFFSLPVKRYGDL